MHVAAMRGDVTVLRALLDNGCPAVIPNKDRWLPIHEAIQVCG